MLCTPARPQRDANTSTVEAASGRMPCSLRRDVPALLLYAEPGGSCIDQHAHAPSGKRPTLSRGVPAQSYPVFGPARIGLAVHKGTRKQT